MAIEPRRRDDRERPDGAGPETGEGVGVEDPIGNPALGAHLYIPLYKDRWHDDRTDCDEFRTRTPAGVEWLTQNEVRVTVVNAGRIASDLVWLDWQVRFCVDATHTPEMGYTFDHAGENGAGSLEAVLSASTIPSRTAQPFLVRWDAPNQQIAALRNIYFRARISGLWSRRLPPNEWDFARDEAVAEAHLAVL